jgi:hypothetical protein
MMKPRPRRGKLRRGPFAVPPPWRSAVWHTLEDFRMSRVNAFARVSNSAGRQVSVGGRGAADSVRGWFNVATRAGEYAASFRAECVGAGLRAADRRRKGTGDDRAAVFTLTLPEASDAVSVRIVDPGESARKLLGFGAFLVTMREAVNLADGIASGETTDGAAAAAAARSRVDRAAALVPPPPPLPRVILPGGVEMSEALAALAWVNADPSRAAAFAADRGTA